MEISLPEPKTKGKISIEEAVFKRKPYRKFITENLSKDAYSVCLDVGILNFGRCL